MVERVTWRKRLKRAGAVAGAGAVLGASLMVFPVRAAVADQPVMLSSVAYTINDVYNRVGVVSGQVSGVNSMVSNVYSELQKVPDNSWLRVLTGTGVKAESALWQARQNSELAASRALSAFNKAGEIPEASWWVPMPDGTSARNNLDQARKHAITAANRNILDENLHGTTTKGREALWQAKTSADSAASGVSAANSALGVLQGLVSGNPADTWMRVLTGTTMRGEEVLWQSYQRAGRTESGVSTVGSKVDNVSFLVQTAKGFAEGAESAAEAARSGVLGVQSTLEDLIDSLSVPPVDPGDEPKGWTQAAIDAVLGAVEALAEGMQQIELTDEECRRRRENPAWWTSLTSGQTTQASTCAVDEETERALRELDERRRQATEEVRKRVEDLREAAREAARKAEQDEKRGWVEGLRSDVDGLKSAVGDGVETLNEGLRTLGTGLGEKLDEVARAVREGNAEEPGEVPGEGPPAEAGLPSSMPRATAWGAMGSCAPSGVSTGGCDTPSIDLGFMIWKPFGDCSMDRSHLHRVRDAVGVMVLVGCAALCVRWIISAIGVPTPSSRS